MSSIIEFFSGVQPFSRSFLFILGGEIARGSSGTRLGHGFVGTAMTDHTSATPAPFYHYPKFYSSRHPFLHLLPAAVGRVRSCHNTVSRLTYKLLVPVWYYAKPCQLHGVKHVWFYSEPCVTVAVHQTCVQFNVVAPPPHPDRNTKRKSVASSISAKGPECYFKLCSLLIYTPSSVRHRPRRNRCVYR